MEPYSETNEVDRHVGSRVRLARLHLQTPPSRLAREIGVSEFELRRIEVGGLRLSARRLYALSKALGQPVGFFFEGLG